MISAQTTAASNRGRLEHELASLFSKRVLADSKLMSRAEMLAEAELVAEGVRQLREHEGNPIEQRLIVQGMDELTAIALCKWIREAI